MARGQKHSLLNSLTKLVEYDNMFTYWVHRITYPPAESEGVAMNELNGAVLAFAKEHGRIPGENLSDLRDALIAEKLLAWGDADERLCDAL